MPLVDGFARRVKDLRISITDRCNLRCSYCMPAEGMAWLPRTEVLTYEEIARVARLCVERFGFEAIRLTGGEPLVRAHVTRLVEMLAPLGVDLALTTNGVKLAEVAHDLQHAGLTRVNVSLDTLQRDRFLALTRRDELDRVIAGIDAALDAGLAPVKVNAVVMRGVNDDEIVDLARFGRDRGVGMRFIEFMPLDAQGAWSEAQVVPAREIIDRIAAEFPLEPSAARARRAGGALALRRRARRRRRDPERDRAVLRELRPRAHHGRGPVPHVLVRARRDRPARRAARRRRARRARSRRPSGRRDRARGRPASGPATASARSTSSAPTAR